MTKRQTQRAYRLKHNITNTADVCEIAHKKTVQMIHSFNVKFGENFPVDCKRKGFCKVYFTEEQHYTDKAQAIFNDYYDLICDNAGL